jgi:Dyp-type peroxidase family
MNHLELQDIQGIIARGYGNLKSAAYVLLHIQDPALARQWLGNSIDRVQTCQDKPTDRCLNIAFTYEGLQTLGLPPLTLTSFPTEFQEGMTEPNRSRILGDREGSDNDPKSWLWGGTAAPQSVHILLLLYAIDDGQLSELYTAVTDELAHNGVNPILKLDTLLVEDERGYFREHFGFRDAIGQPIIQGLNRTGSADNTVKAGEFILGYPNQYNLLTESPRVEPECDPRNILPLGEFGYHDLGRNGSYLVFRQLEQKVEEFWCFLDRVTQNSDGSSNPAARLQLAAKMVGRWPSGTSLVQAPDRDDPTIVDRNDFAYYHSDPQGLRCPIGAHVRRSNPRDSLDPAPGTEKSIAVNKTHRLLRRGRPYGKPIDLSFDRDAIFNNPPAGERGIHFLCINANISRQFEFVQHTWLDNPKFSGLDRETDPLVGDRHTGNIGNTAIFTEQAVPIRKQVSGLPQWVVVRGGAYFFLPGIRAIQYLISISS